MKFIKSSLIIVIVSLLSFSISAQDITGTWNSVLNAHGTQLKLTFHIQKEGQQYNGTLDSPDQGAFGIPLSMVSFTDKDLKINMDAIGAVYEGTLNSEDEISGNFKQAGQVFPLHLSKKEVQKVVRKRPQEPKKPYPYHTEEVIFENKKAKIKLAGTLTLPQKEGKFPVVILISGSGPQDRNEEVFGHKPFLVLSDHLTRKGIGVLRYDDRGFGASTGTFETATSYDLSTDTEAAINYLKTRKEVQLNNIGLIGHSEGGLIAPMVASRNDDVAHIVLLAGPGMPGDELLVLQQSCLMKLKGVTEKQITTQSNISKKAFEIIKGTSNIPQLKGELRTYLSDVLEHNPEVLIPAGGNKEAFIKDQITFLATPWMQYFVNYNPFHALEKTNCPVLAINGEKDFQVPPKENLDIIKNALEKGGNKNATIKELKGMNHLFQECETGDISEYNIIEQSFSPIALEEISNWLLAQTK